MHISVIGALVGLGVAVVMFLFDYLALRAGATERAKRLFKKTVEFDGSERKRISSLLRFCFFLPPGFALAFWMIWG